MKWKHGDKKRIADKVGISKSYFADILHGRRRPSPDLARDIESAALELRYWLSRNDLMYPEESKNPLLRG